ncbi:hypothetical protein C8R45DRAFT_1038932 [Mycena sanguinolenta]|nr:hypothetical protein C8R45DRAFT_1038932 [Mycena sanguinolenta]
MPLLLFSLLPIVMAGCLFSFLRRTICGRYEGFIPKRSARWTRMPFVICLQHPERDACCCLRRHPVSPFHRFDGEERKFPFSAINLFHLYFFLGALMRP